MPVQPREATEAGSYAPAPSCMWKTAKDDRDVAGHGEMCPHSQEGHMQRFTHQTVVCHGVWFPTG